ncbi:unnamed protein product, partial [Brenthis ino]
MKTKEMFLFTAFLLTCISSLNCLDNVPPEITRLNFFDTDLLRYVAEDKTGNVMVSPASIKSVLAMILEGTDGNTEAEIRSALRLSPYKDELREQLNLYLAALNANTTGVSLQNANIVFVSKRLKLKKEYEQIVRKVYYSEIGTTDFEDTSSAASEINNWINFHTKGLITNLVQSSDINPSSDSMFINALYFKGSWRHAFNPKHTRPGCFYKQRTCHKVAMMELHKDLNYAFVDNLRAHALELPYEGNRYSMIILVPQDHDGIYTLIRDLPYMSLPQIGQLLQPASVRLTMPKFTVDYSASMVEPLRKMRINSLFTKEANITGMFENEASQVNNILHKVYMSVDEIGTVAAAATAALVIPLIEDGIQLRVDRPFVFVIRDNQLGLSLFEGKIEEPTVILDDNVLVNQKKQNVDAVHRNWQVRQYV